MPTPIDVPSFAAPILYYGPVDPYLETPAPETPAPETPATPAGVPSWVLIGAILILYFSVFGQKRRG